MVESENKSDKKLEEANFEVSSLAEVKDENGNGIFHMRTKTKFVLAISILIFLSAGALIYLALENIFLAEVWQLAVWGLCGVLAVYSIFAKSLSTMLLNLVLFFGVSLIPVWQAGHETFKPVIEKFTSAPTQETEPVPVEVPEKNSEVENKKIPESERQSAVEDKKNSDTEKNSVELEQKNNSSAQKLPTI